MALFPTLSMRMSAEAPRSIESIEDLVMELRTALDRAKKVLHSHGRTITTFDSVIGHCLEVPASRHRGVLVRNLGSLSNIAISGMSRQEAVEHALDQVFGTRQPMPQSAPSQHLYVVELTFATSDGKVPALMVGKIEEAAVASDVLRATYDGAAQCLNQPHSSTDFAFIDSVTEYRRRMGDRSATQESAVQAANLHIESLQREVQERSLNSEQSPLAVWIANNTDMSYMNQIFGLCTPADGGTYRLVPVPPTCDSDDSVVKQETTDTARILEQGLRGRA